MKNILALTALLAILSGCVVADHGYYASGPDVVAVGFYDPVFGYWSGSEWDVNFYEYGHRGYGHPRYYGGRYVHGGHDRH